MYAACHQFATVRSVQVKAVTQQLTDVIAELQRYITLPCLFRSVIAYAEKVANNNIKTMSISRDGLSCDVIACVIW